MAVWYKIKYIHMYLVWTEADLRYVKHLCRRAKSFSEDNYCFALLRSCLFDVPLDPPLEDVY